MSISVNSPSGTRDFLPEDMAKRNYIFKTITSVFEKFAFLPIETPALENIETLTGKYGDEGDQLLYKILVSRPFESKNKEGIREAFEKSLEKPVNDPRITDKALRYDLTVPFARFVVKHKNNISFPFKRYQIQPGIFSMRCRCHWQRLTPVRMRADFSGSGSVFSPESSRCN
jgi:histidyl-tRNA synthetase